MDLKYLARAGIKSVAPRVIRSAIKSLFMEKDRDADLRWKPCRGISVMRKKRCSFYVLKSKLMPVLLYCHRLKKEMKEFDSDEETDIDDDDDEIDEDADDWGVLAKRRKTEFSIGECSAVFALFRVWKLP